MMINARSSSKFLLAALAAGTVVVSLANAEIPAGYAGKPYPLGSTPKELPGRLNFSEYDLGGLNVSFYADDRKGTGYGSDSAKVALRKQGGDTDWPSMYGTNQSIWDLDTFYTDGVVWPHGVRYPSATDTTISDFYIGASHGNSWTKWTVHVSKAGKYWISSIWTAMEQPAHFQISFLNGDKTVTTPTDTFTGVASYHAWKKLSDFASVQLDTGVQVVFFQNGTNHLNQDFLYIAADSGMFMTGISPSSQKSTSTGPCDLSVNRETIRFTLPDVGKTKISVFDCLGREIMPVLNKTLSAGSHSALLNTANLKKGIYFVRMEHNNIAVVAKFRKFD
jgi:hypothetical protein